MAEKVKHRELLESSDVIRWNNMGESLRPAAQREQSINLSKEKSGRLKVLSELYSRKRAKN